jgi:hypothetical protein
MPDIREVRSEAAQLWPGAGRSLNSPAIVREVPSERGKEPLERNGNGGDHQQSATSGRNVPVSGEHVCTPADLGDMTDALCLILLGLTRPWREFGQSEADADAGRMQETTTPGDSAKAEVGPSED